MPNLTPLDGYPVALAACAGVALLGAWKAWRWAVQLVRIRRDPQAHARRAADGGR